jgi:hypothetical protein
MKTAERPFAKSYSKCIEISKRVRWDIDRDVFRDRSFEPDRKFLPDGITFIDSFDFLESQEKVFLSQIQGRTYANMFGFVERFITAKILEQTKDFWLGDQIALEALVRFCDEEIKHQLLFNRIESMLQQTMPPNYKFYPDPNQVALAVLSKSSWAVLAVILEIELFTQEHYKASIENDSELSELYKDVFLFHWKEETTHAIMDELEWPRVDAMLTPEERDRAVGEVIEIISDFDSILNQQSNSDIDYFLAHTKRPFNQDRVDHLFKGTHKAYRHQYIFSGVQHPRFQFLLNQLTSSEQRDRLERALATLN